ncbi:MAG: glycosyltransferase [Kiritimatiellae bacterium]|nr:glycosyltransferase [Kiritimatiellia bacterium]
MKTSVLINVYNRPDMLAACLRALALGPRMPDEAIVSDDGSDEKCVRKMRAAFDGLPFPVRYVRQEHKGYRLAAVRNNAVRASTGEYLVFIDCDILLLPETLEKHLRRAGAGRFLAGNRALLDKDSSASALRGSISARLLETLWDEADKSRLPKIHRRFQRNLLLRRLGLSAPHKPKILGCHFSLFRKDVERVNGFDENFTGWGLEDDDFARRLYRAGVKGLSVVQDARALHLWHQPADSKPQAISASPNWNYFKRPHVPAYCKEGINP